FIICMICFLTLFFSLPVFSQDPIADFTTDQTSGCSGMVVIFTDQSKNATSWSWNFPGGNPSSASTQGPHQVTYSNIGSFDVSLEVEGNNSSDKKYKTGYITVNDCSPSANFSFSPSSGCSPLTVTYTDQSADAGTWSWSFPGGNPSGAQTKGPHTVTYSGAGSYSATLVVANQYGQDTKTKNHVVNVSRCLDFGDAPAPYPTTLQQNGARHTYNAALFLGQGVDREADGQPDSTATGDDNNGQNDEDGVEWLDELVPNDTARVIITASAGGYLKAWIDFNRDGDWEDEGEEVLDEQIGGGANELEVPVPDDAVEGNTYARFRYSDEIIPSSDGEVNGGEVEDMRVFIHSRRLFDYGDAPDDDTFHYHTLFSHNGARHPVDASLFIGKSTDGPPDMELEGKQSTDALGDNTDGDNDENGVIIANHSAPGEVTLIDAWLTGEGYLHGWVDFNCDGDFTDIDEYCVEYDNTSPSSASLHHLSWVTPETAVPGTTYARFRYCTDPGPFSSDGRGGFGEVEDYQIEILPVKNDYGDAPERYNTSGFEAACHPVSPTVRLGTYCDPDSADQPGDKADGDDTDMYGDDEDGVVFTDLIPGNATIITVTTRGFGFLHAWIDYNHDGDWDDPAEYIIRGDPKSDETTDYSINVPINASVGYTYARFRYKRRYESQLNSPDMDTFGESLPGEVEDYRIHIGQMLLDYGDAPDEPFPTFHQNNGARHIIDPDVYLGLGVSGENDGKPDSLALGDDDDGVEQLGAMIIGDTTLFNITASTTGFLKAWIDYNGDGDWEDETEEICDTQINMDANELAIYIPDDATEGPTYGRFRFSEDTIPSFDGEVYSGEVEDMRFYLTSRYIYDYGDAPENDTLHYETLLASNGARHPISISIGLGTVGSSHGTTHRMGNRMVSPVCMLMGMIMTGLMMKTAYSSRVILPPEKPPPLMSG
ncbi:PKD domain-containing protein, partial [bacterium]|nr:PKD domain-containing protein [bacterium]